jgi:hypothetical protein
MRAKRAAFSNEAASGVTGVTDIGVWRTSVGALGEKERELHMTSVPITRDPPRSAYSGVRPAKPSATGWLATVLSDRNLIIVAALCLIGLLLTLNLIFRFPIFQPSLEEIGQILG